VDDPFHGYLDLDEFQPFEGYHLWEHQKEAIETALSARRCMIQLPTGSGKTVTMATFLKMFPAARVVVVSPSESITRNNKDTIEAVTGEEVGCVYGGKKVYRRITSATQQSIYNKILEDPDAFNDISILIFDECHTVGYTKTFWTINRAFMNTAYRIGLSGTAWREYGDNLAMEGYIGPLIYDVKAETLQKKGILVNFDYLAIPIKDDPYHQYPKFDKKNFRYKTNSGKPERLDVYKRMIINNDERNNAIVKLAKEYYNRGLPYGPGLIIAESLDHSQYLYNQLCSFMEEGTEVEYVKGGGRKNHKIDVINRLRSAELSFVVCTKVFNVGVDFPAVGFLINAGGGNATSNLIQKLGRIVRKFKNKTKALVVDFEDLEGFYLNRNFKNRTRALTNQYPSTPVKKVDSADDIINHYF
jgi:superfamily II DNA or RNA helicase